MKTTFRSVSIDPLAVLSAADAVYTMPAGASGMIISAIGATTNGAARSAGVWVQRAGSVEIERLSDSISIAAGGAGSLLPGKPALSAGDKIGAVVNTAALARSHNSPWPSIPTLLLSNADGTVIVGACGTYGLWTSTDGGLTAVQTLNADMTGVKVGVYFGGAFHVYTSATSKRTSANGTAWSTVACTNAPQAQCTATGSIIDRGSMVVGLAASGTQLVSSTDGTAWSSLGAALPAACASLCWTGTNWVAGNSGGNGNIYIAPAAATPWTTVAGRATTAVNIGGIACLGGNVVALMGNQAWMSANHGATFAQDASIASMYGFAMSTGQAIAVANASGVGFVNRSGSTGQWLQTSGGSDAISYQLVLGSCVLAIAGTRVVAYNGRSYDLALTARGGLTVTLSVMEVVS